MSKLTEEQFNHYIKGGKFKAIYNPVNTNDITQASKSKIGSEIVVYKNMIVAPLANYSGDQHAFNSNSITGWFPEQDIEIIGIIQDDFISYSEKLPIYMYRLIYTERNQLKGNFGNGYENTSLPFEVQRDYSYDKDNYVLKLSKPQATKILKYIWKGTYNEKLDWEVLLDNSTENDVL